MQALHPVTEQVQHREHPARSADPRCPVHPHPFCFTSRGPPSERPEAGLLRLATMGRHGDETSPEEREENAAAQAEELEALEAIYGDSCCEIDRSAASAAPEV